MHQSIHPSIHYHQFIVNSSDRPVQQGALLLVKISRSHCLQLSCCVHSLYHPGAYLDLFYCVQVVCGLDHTLALSHTGEAYAFGDNSLCQLGRVGDMGVQTPDTTPHNWIIHDEDHAPIQFTKVALHMSPAFLSHVNF